MKLLTWVLDAYRKLEVKLIKMKPANEEVEKSPYTALTPKKIIDEKGNEYFKALRYALSQQDVRNLAVTGAYGAGKSTVIHSYMEMYEKDRFISVSLAGFDMQENVEPARSQEVELSILQQILYKKNRDDLPDSRIDRILNRNQAHIWRVFWSVFKVIAPVGSFLALVFHKKFLEVTGIPQEVFSFIQVLPYPKAIFLVVLFFAALYFISEFASQIGIFDKKIKLNKVALLSGEMELESGETSSLLNNCLDEIVYFFSRMQNYRIVIFEDLDRLRTHEIFVKLREINKIVNNNLSEDRPLRFVYAVRDDIFAGADSRTKFFDFIIPVVPVMDGRNAFSLLNGHMEGMILGGEDCLRGTAVYISDMRLLQNIVNEFLVFSKVVDNNNRKVNLYALIFYKNTFSHDYALIDRKISVLYRFVQDYRLLRLHEDYFVKLENTVSSLSDKLNSILKEKASTSKDVRQSIVHSIIPAHLTDVVYFQRSADGYNFRNAVTQNIIDDEKTFIDLLEEKGRVYIGYGNGNANKSHLLHESERLALRDDYISRKALTGEERRSTFELVKSELAVAKERIRRRNAISLSELVTLISLDKFSTIADRYLDEMDTHDFITDDQKKIIRSEMRYGGVDALYLLLSRGFLDQDFMRSRSIFQKGGLSVNDNEFVKSVALGLSCEKANAEYVIDDVNGVILEIHAQHLLHHDAVMHHQIISHMIRIKDTRIDEMIATLFSKNSVYIFKLFVLLETRFVAADSFSLLLVRALDNNGYLDTFVTCLKASDNSEQQSRIAAAVVSWISPDRADNRAEYRKYVESLGTGIVHFIEPARLQSFLTYIEGLKVCYEALSSPLTDEEKDCVRFIGTHHLYRLTSENVGIVLSTQLYSHAFTVRECQDLPWTFATSYDPNTLQYFVENPDTFVRSVFLNSQEEASAVNAVLKLTSLSDEMKLSIVKEMHFCMDTLSDVPFEPSVAEREEILSFHDVFYRHDRIYPGWQELIRYMAGGCNRQILTDFMARHAITLGLSCPEMDDENAYGLLYENIICNIELNESDYIKILTHVEINTGYFDERISDGIIIRLLKNSKIPLTESNYTNVISNLSGLTGEIISVLILWFGHYQDEFMSDPEHYLQSGMDDHVFKGLLARVMHSPLFSDTNKVTLYSKNEEYYRHGDEENIDLPENIKISAFEVAADEGMRMRLLISLIAGNYHDRGSLAGMTEMLEEKDLKKIFTQKTGATLSLNDRDGCVPLLNALQRFALIKEYEFREDGKVYVKVIAGDFDARD